MKKKFVVTIREVWNMELVVSADTKEDARVKAENLLKDGTPDIMELIGESTGDGTYIADVKETRSKDHQPHI